ncbi:MAG TPA: hypothetical protein VGI79_05755 [Caulobacteraceae bacterium]|jgi:hypothetical protein
MPVRLVLSVAMALGLSMGLAAGVAQAGDCRRAVRHVIHHPAHGGCHCYRAVSLRHVHRTHVHRTHGRVVENARVEQHEDWSQGQAYGYAEADEHRRWGHDEGGLRPSPVHPWATNRAGYLTWSGKFQSGARYSAYRYDRDSGGAADGSPQAPPVRP